MVSMPQYELVAALLTFLVVGLFTGYFLGLRETKRRLKAHQEVTDRLMGRTDVFPSGGFQRGLGLHDDLLDASSLAGTVYPTYGGISRSSSPFTATGIRNQVGLLGGAGMQNAIITQRGDARSRLYEALKKAME